MTERAFKIGWATLINAFAVSSQTVTPETQDIYWKLLSKLPESAFMNAVTTCLEECKFFPAIAELREAAYRKAFRTDALKQMQLDPPMPKEQAKDVLKNLIASLPDKAIPKVCEYFPWQHSEVQKETNFAQFNRDYIVRDLPCIGCGQIFRLPFANGNEEHVLCEACNR